MNDRHAVDQEEDVIAMMTVVRIDSKLVDNLIRVLASVIDVNESVVEWSAIISRKAASLT